MTATRCEHHPSPPRQRVGAGSAWFAVVGPPAAWSLQQITSPSIFAHGCFPQDVPLAEPIWQHGTAAALAVGLAAAAVCLLAGMVAWRNWQRTRDEKDGSGHQLLASGDGRSRFMAMSGLICSGLFLLAVVLGSSLVYLVPGCYG